MTTIRTDDDPTIKTIYTGWADPSAASVGSLADLVPTTWLDPLLTGPDKVLPDGNTYGPQDIERLLRAVKKRISEAEGKWTHR